MDTTKKDTKYIDYLTEDTPIPGQLWACISFLSPEGIKNCSVRGLKIRGVYGSRPEANTRAEELQKIDPDFHVFVGEVGKWLPWDPEPNDVQDQVYQEKELNDLMKGYKENQEKSKKMLNDRKDETIKQAAREEQSREQKMKNKLKKKLEARKQQSSDKKEIETETEKQKTSQEHELHKLEEALKKEEEMIKEDKKTMDEMKKTVIDSAQKLETIDSKLARIQELYNQSKKQ